MKPLLLILLVSGAHGMVDAQESVSLDQRFQLHYSRWQVGQSATAATTQATYDFNLGLPVLTYRLGALALTGSMDYDRRSIGGESSSTLGLNRYGLRGTLFPYRPFHLSFDYSRTQSPAIAGLERVTGDTYGARLNYRGRAVQDFEVSFKRGSNAQGASEEGWSLWSLVARQNVRETHVSLTASHQDFGGSEGLRWRRSDLYAATDTTLSRNWALRSNLQADESAGVRTLNTDLNLTGTLAHWTSISSLSFGQTGGSSSESRSAMLSQSLALNGERYSAFSSAALSSVQIQGGQGDSNRGTLLLGGAYSLGQGWRASLDVSESFGTVDQSVAPSQGQLGGGASQQNLRTIHGGISQGGDVPGIIRRTLFFLSDRGFQQRIADEYAPGYVPSDLAAEMSRRRFRQSGNFNFAGDLYHIQAEGGEGKADWARLTGQLSVNAGLTFQIIGDWKKDAGLSLPGTRTDSKVFTVNGAYRFGASSVVTNAGYSKNEKSSFSGADDRAQVPTFGAPGEGAASRFLSLGFNSRFWLVPYGVQWTQFEDGWQPSTRTLTGFFTLNFRQVSLRVTYQSARKGDGFRENRVSVDLLRWFDTIAFGGFRR